jgi:hypothetical protein
VLEEARDAADIEARDEMDGANGHATNCKGASPDGPGPPLHLCLDRIRDGWNCWYGGSAASMHRQGDWLLRCATP